MEQTLIKIIGMKKNSYIFLLIIVTISCNNKHNQTERNYINNSNYNSIGSLKNKESITIKRKIETYDFSAPYNIEDKSKIEKIEYLKKLCVKYFLNSKYNITNVKSLNKIWEGQLYSIGHSNVYKLIFQNVALSMGESTLVVVSLDKNIMYRINLQEFEPTYIQFDLPPIFSGRYFYRGGGAFYSYYVVDDTLINFFESDLVTSIIRNDDCKGFKNNELKLKNIDLNNDGFIDLFFEGKKYNYCKGFASRTKNDTIVQDSVPVIYKYYLHKSKNKFYYTKEQ